MTSTPVKELNPLMGYVGGKNFGRAGSLGQSGGFGDVMNMAKSFGQGKENTISPPRQTDKTPATDALKKRPETVKPEKNPQDTAKTDVASDDGTEAVKEAGEKVIQEIAKEFGVTEEEVVQAMEALGLSLASLFDPASLTQLALMLGGEQDPAALLTDENLFASLQNILKVAEETKAGLMQEMNLSLEDFKSMLEGMKNAGQQGEDGLISADAQEDAPQITVEVKAGDETVKLAADENGNAIKTVEVVPSNAKENVSEESDRHSQKDGEGKGQAEGELQAGNPLIDSLTQNKPQVSEVPFEQMTPMLSEQTKDIMNQIMDYMKIQLKPGMDQLEMQLHPESLGTVHIQLLSKGGEVTAHFQVQNEAVKAALESQITTLQESLKEQGVKVEAVQVTVENHGFESNLWQGQGREENASSQGGRKTPRRINLNEIGGFSEEDATEEEILTASIMAANGNTVDYTV